MVIAVGSFGILSNAQAAERLNTDRLEARIQTTYELSPYLRPHELTLAGSLEELFRTHLLGHLITFALNS